MIKNYNYIIKDDKRYFAINGRMLSEKEMKNGYMDLRLLGYKTIESEGGIIYCPYIPFTFCKIINSDKYRRKLKNIRKQQLLNYLKNKRRN